MQDSRSQNRLLADQPTLEDIAFRRSEITQNVRKRVQRVSVNAPVPVEEKGGMVGMVKEVIWRWPKIARKTLSRVYQSSNAKHQRTSTSQSWCTWFFRVALIALASLLFQQAWAGGKKSQTASGEPGAKTIAAKNTATPSRTINPPNATIEHVHLGRTGQQTEVRVDGAGDLSYEAFRLNQPDRLVLDFHGTLVRMQQKSLSNGLYPVSAVRVGQFTANVARVVIELDGQVPYTISANGNGVAVVFGRAAVAEFHQVAKKEVPNVGMVDPPELAPISLADGAESRGETKSLSESLMQSAAVLASPAAPPVEPSLPLPPKESQPVRVQNPLGNAVLVPQSARKNDREASPAPSKDDYVIGPLDVVAINVWREPEVSRIETVRPDGKISLPLVGELKASGLTPQMLQDQISKQLEAYVHRPEVAVIVQGTNSHRFNILGRVQHPGSYLLAGNMTVVDALAAAGGFSDFAKAKKTYVLRRTPDGSTERIPFSYKEAIKGNRLDLNLQLLPGDTIFVP